MRRMRATDLSREECLRLAEEHAWSAEHGQIETQRARDWDHARYFRSLALIAKPAET
jgi:hypothetical protein